MYKLFVGSRWSGQQQPNYVPAQVPVNFITMEEMVTKRRQKSFYYYAHAR